MALGPADGSDRKLFSGWFLAQSVPATGSRLSKTEGAEPVTELIEIAERVHTRGGTGKREWRSRGRAQ